jgi:hypothetical protein
MIGFRNVWHQRGCPEARIIRTARPISLGQGGDAGQAHREDMGSLEPGLQKEKEAKENTRRLEMSKLTKIILWIIVGLFIATPGTIALLTNMQVAVSIRFHLMIAGGISIFALGIVILYLTIRTVIQKELKRYLLLAGASAVAMVFFITWHNFLTPFFDEEPATFVMGIFVCPIAFIVGTVKAFRFKAPQLFDEKKT